MNAQDFSRYEFCPRLPSLFNILDPKQLPIREATKRYFERGIKSFYAGTLPEMIPMEFLQEAAERGYIYPAGEPYVIAQDHGSWLDSVLRLLPDIHLEPLPILHFDGDDVVVDGFHAGDAAHIFRLTDSFDDKVRWPELLLIGEYESITVHQFRLPRVSSGRLLSPASIAYSHPLTGQLRLARLEGESKTFNPSWKRIGRWELRDIGWDEWSEGFAKDKCLDQIYRTHQVTAEFSEDDLLDIRRDAAMMIHYMNRPQPRQRETCGACMYFGYCHGDEVDRHFYLPKENMPQVSTPEGDNSLPSGSVVA